MLEAFAGELLVAFVAFLAKSLFTDVERVSRRRVTRMRRCVPRST
jgi:hypothetical protein